MISDVAFHAHRDTVSDIEILVFAHFLDDTHQIAGHAFGQQFVVHVYVERHGQLTIGGDFPAGQVFRGNDEVVWRDGIGVAIERHI
jgi:hypothetical protein